MRSAMLSRAPRRPLLRLLLLLLLSAAALARPALPEDELAVLEEDLEEDLEDLEDARAVDAAYARLFPPAAEAAEPPAPLGPAPEDSLTAAAGLGALADYDYQGDQPQPDAEDRPSRPGTTDNLTLATTASPTAADVTGGEATPSTAADDDGPHGSVASRTAERESVESTSMERDRELRLHHIKNQVLSYLGLSQNSGHPNVSALSASEQQLSLLRVVGRIGLPNLPPQDIFAEKTLSHYPSCSLPRNTDETLWSGGSAMHLLFDLPNHPPPAGTSVNIVQATLRLFKLSQGNATKAGGEGPICLPSTAAAGDEDGSASDAPLPETTLEGGGAEAEAGPVPLHALLGMATTDDRQVRVSVYWYTRSLKKNKNGVVVEKRKLLDSRMLPVHGSAWTEWNVRTAVKVWRDSGRNFGLVVEVEDEDGTLLDAHQFFNGMNCTQEASTARPLPSFLLDRLYSSNAAGSGRPSSDAASAASGAYPHAFNQNLFPVIDLCTVETTDAGSGGALYSSGYELPHAGLGLGGVRQGKAHAPHGPHAQRLQAQAPRHQAQAHRTSPRQHKHRHQHQQEQEHGVDTPMEPVARRWPRARAQGGEDADDIRGFIIPQRIIMAARNTGGAGGALR